MSPGRDELFIEEGNKIYFELRRARPASDGEACKINSLI